MLFMILDLMLLKIVMVLSRHLAFLLVPYQDIMAKACCEQDLYAADIEDAERNRLVCIKKPRVG